jgi:hypothetical protein
VLLAAVQVLWIAASSIPSKTADLAIKRAGIAFT